MFSVAWLPRYYLDMSVSFGHGGTEDVFNGRNTRHERLGCPSAIWGAARRKLDLLDSGEIHGGPVLSVIAALALCKTGARQDRKIRSALRRTLPTLLK